MGLDFFPGALESLVLFSQVEPPLVLRFPPYVVWIPLVVGLFLLTPIFMSGKEQPGRKWTLVIVGWLFGLPALLLATPMLWSDELTIKGYKLHQTGFLGTIRPERDYDFSNVQVVHTSSMNGAALGGVWKLEYESGKFEEVTLSDLWSFHRGTIRTYFEERGIAFR
jgi:hypothetical protein